MTPFRRGWQPGDLWKVATDTHTFGTHQSYTLVRANRGSLQHQSIYETYSLGYLMTLPHHSSRSTARSSIFLGHREEGAWSGVGTGQDVGPAKSKIKAGKSNGRPVPCQTLWPAGTSHTDSPQSSLVRCVTTSSSSVARWGAVTLNFLRGLQVRGRRDI